MWWHSSAPRSLPDGAPGVLPPTVPLVRRAPVLLAVLSVVCIGTAALLAPTVADAGPTSGGVGTPLASARRIPEVLAEHVGRAEVASVVSEVAAASPERSCLVVGRGTTSLAGAGTTDALAPASGMKLLTATAVLDQLDPASRLRTTVVAALAPAGGVVEGDLFLVGGGDPLLGTADWAGHFERQPVAYTSLEGLADQVVAAGVQVIRGGVFGDGDRYDDRQDVATWPERYRDSGAVGSLSALMVNDGMASWGPVPQPAADATVAGASRFAELLRDRGVQVMGGTGRGSAPEAGVEITYVDSLTIGDLVAQTLRESDNETAELLTKELGLQVGGTGTTAAGTVAIASALVARGLPTDGLVVADGSGLDPGARATCALLASVLYADGPDGPIAQGLAVAGISGTLIDRLQGTAAYGRVRAKTGTLNEVSTLAGWVDTDGGDLWFAYIQDGIRGIEPSRQRWDQLAVGLVSYPGVDVAGLGPSTGMFDGR